MRSKTTFARTLSPDPLGPLTATIDATLVAPRAVTTTMHPARSAPKRAIVAQWLRLAVTGSTGAPRCTPMDAQSGCTDSERDSKEECDKKCQELEDKVNRIIQA